MRKRNLITGKFERTRSPWSLANFDDGYVDANGRMRVYKPGHPRSSNMGYVMRSIVAFESYHGVLVSINFNIHHKDYNRLNDSKENLEIIEHAEHTRRHKTKASIKLICTFCKKDFLLKQCRINAGRGKYCSQACYRKKGLIQ